jgi:hypothetical protein
MRYEEFPQLLFRFCDSGALQKFGKQFPEHLFPGDKHRQNSGALYFLKRFYADFRAYSRRVTEG